MIDLERFSLEGKVAMITGGSAGIGKSTAIAFARAGADVAVVSRKLPNLEKVAEEIEAVGRKALPVAAHMGKVENIQSAVDAVVGEFGKIDVLVNNAATSPAYAAILDSEERLWDSIMNLNLKGAYFLSQAVARQMKGQGSGSIINISSIDGYKPQQMISIYSISKAAINMLTKASAVELAPYNIRVNGIAPGAVRTRFFEGLFAHLPEDQIEETIKLVGSKFPLKRVGMPDEIVGAMIFLASEASSYMTGETIVIDGGALQTGAL